MTKWRTLSSIRVRIGRTRGREKERENTMKSAKRPYDKIVKDFNLSLRAIPLTRERVWGWLRLFRVDLFVIGLRIRDPRRLEPLSTPTLLTVGGICLAKTFQIRPNGDRIVRPRIKLGYCSLQRPSPLVQETRENSVNNISIYFVISKNCFAIVISRSKQTTCKLWNEGSRVWYTKSR